VSTCNACGVIEAVQLLLAEAGGPGRALRHRSDGHYVDTPEDE
jgi:hypothetical protein